jgi:hypothetical protein
VALDRPLSRIRQEAAGVRPHRSRRLRRRRDPLDRRGRSRRGRAWDAGSSQPLGADPRLGERFGHQRACEPETGGVPAAPGRPRTPL